MTLVDPVEQLHPIVECAVDLRASLKGVAPVEPVFMSVGEKRAALVELVAARSQLDGLLSRVLAASDDVGTVEGSRDAVPWVAAETRSTRREVRRDLALGRAMENHPEVGRLLADGTLRAEQARAIVEAVDALPDRVDVAVREEAEARLLAYARLHDARALRQIGKRILDVVAPEVGESAEADALAEEERRAAESVSFLMSDDGEGRCHGRFTVPSHVGAILRRILQALANPARHTEGDLRDENGVWKPSRRRMGEAFVEYVERYPLDATPQTAGVSVSVVVAVTLQDLLGEHAVALLDDGTRMSAAQARRLACEAGIVPVVLGGDGQVLDLGRSRRLFSKAQRIALGLRDGGCTAKGCETTASGCHAHHDDPWSNGGATDLVNGRLLCPRHHRLAHDPRYAKTIHADNQVSFTMRT
ncbi:HNH endonuclease signature motif containing protein [Nocardioides okcheonensis]|uniref:HNH endonuclease signature motif containing protein n=1 Tax=Nocardioides okcheonensis TaxID=2894081 RepID=UPI001E2FD40A|nr:HNH endonuclease signature motif containing protein [Nocardioides okcheonensis]UFN45441.1 HNH endonuclease [Nocardioides okcheonensis]